MAWFFGGSGSVSAAASSSKGKDAWRGVRAKLAAWWQASGWYVPLGLLLAGFVLAPLQGAVGTALFLAGTLALAARALLDTLRRGEAAGGGRLYRWLAYYVGGVVMATAAVVVVMNAGVLRDAAQVRFVLGVLAAQGFLVLVGLDPGAPRKGMAQRLTPLVGHATLLAGSWLLLHGDGALYVLRFEGPFDGPAAFAYLAGFSVLALHAFWEQRLREGSRAAEGWESLLLSCVAMGALALAAKFLLVEAGLLSWPMRAANVLLLSCLLVMLSVLASPPPAPARVAASSEGVRQFLAQATAAVAVLNLFLLVAFLAAGWSIMPVFSLLLGWLALAALLELAAFWHFLRRRAPARVRRARVAPLTVVIAAANERDVLRESLQRNLALPLPLRFLLVPATKSVDGTVQAALDLAREHPGRVRVVLGDTGSKAEDLNKAWPLVDTPYALILDADEVIDAAGLRRGLHVLATEPDVGVVQGRKVSKAPEESFLARLISAERRYSTLIDHTFQSEVFGAAHFAGSAALLRREVPMSVGGWHARSLTEDIEFALRLHLAGRWRIRYVPEMVAYESDPRNFKQLVRQRQRWSRGWTECFRFHFHAVVRSPATLGRRRAFGLAWQLLTSVSAPWSIFLPTLLVLLASGMHPSLPVLTATALGLLILPSRYLTYAIAAWLDPVIPTPRTWRGVFESLLDAALWIVLGWYVQLSAIYHEVSRAPKVWHVTAKKTHGPDPAIAGAP